MWALKYNGYKDSALYNGDNWKYTETLERTAHDILLWVVNRK
jgi:hypothetical protein